MYVSQVYNSLFCHSSLIPYCLVGSRPPYDLTGELGWVGPIAFGIGLGPWPLVSKRDVKTSTEG